MLMIHNLKRHKENYGQSEIRQTSKMTTRFVPPWYLRCWVLLFPRSRLHVSSSHLNYSITIFLFFAVFFSLLVISQILTNSNPTPRPKYIPMVEFNRGDVSKDQVMENARRALEKVEEFQQTSGETHKDHKSVFRSLLQVMDKKEKRQFLALAAFNIYDMDDFESLMEIGYETNKASNFTSPPIDYKNNHKNIKNVSPDYDKLCYSTFFTLSNSKRPQEKSFCERLKLLETEIKGGRELPLLTIYTWWPDPITDPEVLSKRAVLANWDLLRPFIVPVVFTNFRMNMAVANAHGWPCLPVEAENEAGLPLFKHTAAAMDKMLKFKSTFYGYAMANSMFDASLLQTLLSIKDRFVHNTMPPQKVDSSDSTQELEDSDTPKENPLLIYGKPIRTPAVGLETFEKMEYFHKHVENAIKKNESIATSLKHNYIIYRGVDFSHDAPVVIDDDYLVLYLIERRMRYPSVLIDTSETILCAKTHRHLDVNEWGRKYIRTKPRDKMHNKKYLEAMKSERAKKGDNNIKAKCLMTVYDDKNNVRVMSTNSPLSLD